jgi:hypothetical protein
MSYETRCNPELFKKFCQRCPVLLRTVNPPTEILLTGTHLICETWVRHGGNWFQKSSDVALPHIPLSGQIKKNPISLQMYRSGTEHHGTPISIHLKIFVFPRFGGHIDSPNFSNEPDALNGKKSFHSFACFCWLKLIGKPDAEFDSPYEYLGTIPSINFAQRSPT